MKLKQGKYLIILLVIGITAIIVSKTSNYLNEKKNWDYYTKNLDPKISLHSTSILLILRSNECEPVFDELKIWNDIYLNSDYNIYLILIDKYNSNRDIFAKVYDLEIPIHLDSTGAIFKNKLIPNSPFIVGFDDNKISIYRSLGANITYDEIISEL